MGEELTSTIKFALSRQDDGVADVVDLVFVDVSVSFIFEAVVDEI